MLAGEFKDRERASSRDHKDIITEMTEKYATVRING